MPWVQRTDSLIPLFAVGAFIAFTLSQAGVVVHWKRKKGRHWRQFMIINGIGMAATAVTTLVVLVSKFTEGAWIVVLALAAILLFMKNVKKHYTAVQKQLYSNIPLKEEIMKKSIVVLPADEWNNNVSKACLLFYRGT
jgi:amino acid transporter